MHSRAKSRETTSKAPGPIRDKFCFAMTENQSYGIAVVVGGFGILIANYFYTPIDGNLVIAIILIAFVILMLARVTSSVRGQLSLGQSFLKRVVAVAFCIPAAFCSSMEHWTLIHLHESGPV
jgi:hypothetical protein